MIKSFRCQHTEALYLGKTTKRFRAFPAVAERKHQIPDIARRIEDLRMPPVNRLEAPRGRLSREAKHSDKPSVALVFSF
jgi:proteic killer suppression protein